MCSCPAVASLLLVTLPFASEKPVAIDHPLSYLGLFAVLLAGYVWNLVSQAQQAADPVAAPARASASGSPPSA